MTPNAVDTAEVNLENIFRVVAVCSCPRLDRVLDAW